MEFLTSAISGLPEFRQLKTAVDTRALPAVVTGLSGIHKANVIYSLCALSRRRAFVVASDEAEAQRLQRDLESMGMHPLLYPTRDFTFRDTAATSHEYEHSRLHVLSGLLSGDCDCVIACIDAALQYTMPETILRKRTVSLSTAQEISPEALTALLLSCGYERAEQVEGPGQFAQRGGIFDFFPPNSTAPVRIEFWGDEIDTITYFDPESQRRTDQTDSITITPAVETPVANATLLAKQIREHASGLRGKTAPAAKAILLQEAESLEAGVHLSNADKFISFLYPQPATLFDYCDGQFLLFVSDPMNVKERIRTTTWQWGEDLRDLLAEGILCRGLDSFAQDAAYAADRFAAYGAIYLDSFAHGNYDAPLRTAIHLSVRQLSAWGGSIGLLTEDLRAMLYNRWACAVLAGNERSARTTALDLQKEGIDAEFVADPKSIRPGSVVVTTGTLSAGLEYPNARFGMITHGQLSIPKAQRRRRNKNSKEIYSLAELTPGDYVVHASHGIGIFDGIRKIDMQGITKDYIKIRYAKADTLYVPVTQLDLVSKYIGPREDSAVKLHRLGGTEWQKAKSRVRKAVQDMAKDLIALYAARMQTSGHAFSADTEWQHDFEAHFEYEETEDQLRCIDEIKSDMERSVPMDRLLCGDVGFGKTEVALRAAFKCITDSKQCALLVPTTILAWQHYQTVLGRMEGFPVKVELLSRFRTPKQQTEILHKLARGEIDMVIGTHRLVSKDVQFRDLGLVIIDEEQRFGVAQKEHLKTICKNVDVLTLSATPIPRTLSMALSGIRDMSVIEEAPHDRHPVQSYVLEYDIGILTDAIRRELRRGGQVYYLHNDIGSLERTAARIQSRIPEARIGIAHGRMGEGELSEIWKKLIEQELDILVCTTIIETGLDVPNVNTLIIDNADRMGLSQLHQLRGRVGRSSRRAYAYFTFTPDKVLSEIAQKRLSAIREFTEFGSGFKIAMRDLEIRGAGNILGGEQHGQMESVGYDMYLKLLDEAISREKGEPTAPADAECLIDLRIEAHIPEQYIPSLTHRLEVYRRIADIRNTDDAEDVMDELIDRFGEPPEAVQGLIDIALLRNTAMALGIYEIKQQERMLLLYTNTLDIQMISKMGTARKGQIVFGTGSRPYIGIKTQPDAPALTVLADTLKIMQNSRS